MTIAFVWPFAKAHEIEPNWRDGLRSALDLLAKDHTVEWFVGSRVPTEAYDAYLVWDDSNSAVLAPLKALGGKLGLFLTTDPHNIANLKLCDVVYCESQPVYDQVRRQGLRAIRAFGTDTDLFSPDPTVEKTIPYFYPATFSPWKRQSSISHLGRDLLCVGTVQPDGLVELQSCRGNNVRVELGYFPVEQVRDWYRQSHNVLIPAIHGSERTVLEAMSMDLQPRVSPDNAKAYSYVREYLDSGLHSPREFVLSRYTAKHYADQIAKGIT